MATATMMSINILLPYLTNNYNATRLLAALSVTRRIATEVDSFVLVPAAYRDCWSPR